MSSLVQKQELIKTYNEQKEILKIKKSAYQAADDDDSCDDENVMKLYNEYHVLKKVVLEMEAQIAEMNEDPVKCVLDGEDPGSEKVGGAAEWANDDKSEVTEPVVVPPTPVVVPPTPVVVPPTPVVVPPTPVVAPPTPVVVPPTPVVVPPTPVVVVPTPVVVPSTPTPSPWCRPYLVRAESKKDIEGHQGAKDFYAEYNKQIVEEGKDCLTLEECEYRVREADCAFGMFVLNKPSKIIGQGRGMTTLVGVSLQIKGNKSDGIVEIENLTIKGAQGVAGLDADKGMNVIMRGCTVEVCSGTGVQANGADISCDNLQVVGCGDSGVYAYNRATITLSGQGTSIQGNVQNKNRKTDYGLKSEGKTTYRGCDKAYSTDSKIHLVHPLTKEQISTNNGPVNGRRRGVDDSGGGNWGGTRGCIIDQVDNDGVVLQILYEKGADDDY